MRKPRLSVITINRNDAAGLAQTLKSLFRQTFRDFESIVIDGASTDESIKIIKKFHRKIQKWISEPDTGIYNAMNKGTGFARGEYCLYLNSGDFLASADVLEKIFAQDPWEDILYFDLLIDYGDHTVLGKMPEKVDYEIFVRRQIWHQSLIKRELFKQYGSYDESFRLLGDYDFFLRTIVVHNVSRRYIPLTIAVFNTRGLGSRPENRKLALQERRRSQRKYFGKWDLIWKFGLEHQLGRFIASLPMGKIFVRAYKRVKSFL